MAKVLISPGKYVQGAGEMKKLGEYAQNYGKKALILISKGGYKRIGQWWRKALKEKNVDMFLITSMVNAVKKKSNVLEKS